MPRLPPKTSSNPEINETTPLLHDEEIVIDDELYAIGGAAGFADEHIDEPQTDADNIAETLFSAWLRFPPNISGESERGDSVVLDPRAVRSVSTAWRRIRAERDVLPETQVIVQGLVDCMGSQLKMMVPDGEVVNLGALATHISEIMSEGWQQKFRGIAICIPQTDTDEVVERLFSAWLQFHPHKWGEFEDSELIGPRALHAMSTVWQQIKAERDVLPESEIIVQGLSERMVVFMLQMMVPDVDRKAFAALVTEIVADCWQQNFDEIKIIYGPQTNTDNVIERLFSAWLQFHPHESGEPEDDELISPRALHAMSTVWQQIKAERDVLPESEVIVQGLAECMVDFILQLQIIAPDVDREAFTRHIAEIVEDCWQQNFDGIKIIYGPQTNIDNVVETMFTAWLQFPPNKSDESEREDSELISPRALRTMSTAWRQIEAERDVLPESEVIVERLAECIVDYMHQLQMMVLDGEYVSREAFTAHVTEVVAESLQRIHVEIEEEDARERARKKRERRKRSRERLEKHREVAEVLWFYEPIASEKPEPLNCKRFCIFICLCWSSFILQVFISLLLLAWPLSIGIMGGLYMTQCPMSHLLPYMMMATGVAGTIAILTRLFYALYGKYFGDFDETQIIIMWPWILLKIIEYVCFGLLIIQLYCFYSKTPSFVLGSPQYCNQTLYDFVHWINYVSIAISSLWLIVYSVKLVLTWKMRKYILRPW